MARFEAGPRSGAIVYAAVPWPPEPAAMLRAAVALEGGGGGGGGERKVFRRLSMRWHPDKWQSRYATRRGGTGRREQLRIRGVGLGAREEVEGGGGGSSEG
jgi:hypothetical protein